jgi:Flp pilus assembly protein TadG
MNALLIKRRRIQAHGVAATELAIALPLLVALVLVSVDLGRFAFLAITLDNAARVGAERGATRSFTSLSYTSWLADVENHATEVLSDSHSGGYTNAQIGVSTATTADNLTLVTVSAQADLVPTIPWPFMSGNLTIRRQISLEQFR